MKQSEPDQEQFVTAREHLRKRQVYGLLLIAAVILVVALLRANLHDIFPRGWWRF